MKTLTELMRGRVRVEAPPFSLAGLTRLHSMDPISMNYQLLIKETIAKTTPLHSGMEGGSGNLYPTPATRDVIK